MCGLKQEIKSILSNSVGQVTCMLLGIAYSVAKTVVLYANITTGKVFENTLFEPW